MDAYDITNDVGTNVYAPFAGRVTHKQSFDKTGTILIGYGNHAVLRADNGYNYNLAHLSAFEREGTVAAGDVVGYMGNTGNSTGPHLHYELGTEAGLFNQDSPSETSVNEQVPEKDDGTEYAVGDYVRTCYEGAVQNE